MMKKAQVVMLPTENKAALFKNIRYPDHLQVGDNTIDNPYWLGQHLYVVTYDKIKSGDWCISMELGELFQCAENRIAEQDTLIATSGTFYIHSNDPHYVMKVVATTNPNLWIKQLPNMSEGTGWRPSDIARIPTDFVEAYVREQGKIIEVNLEYEIEDRTEEWSNFNNPLINLIAKLKLRSNGTVIIHPVKERTFTQEEVEKMLGEYGADVAIGIQSGKGIPYYVKWFKEYLTRP